MIIDLFETPELIPAEVVEILDSFSGDFDYKEIERLKTELESIGYTFDYGLDADPYNLRKL